jgi:putative NADH-flavin reductase
MAGSITVVGATGFIGRHLVPLLVRSGEAVRLALRHPDRVQMTIEPPQAPELIQADVLDDVAVGSAVAGTDAVVTRDQVKLLKTDKVVSGAEPTLGDLGVQPPPLEEFLPVLKDKYR